MHSNSSITLIESVFFSFLDAQMSVKFILCQRHHFFCFHSAAVLQFAPSMHQNPIFSFGPSFQQLFPLHQQSHNLWRRNHREKWKSYLIWMKWTNIENYVYFFKYDQRFSPNSGYFSKFSKYWLQVGSGYFPSIFSNINARQPKIFRHFRLKNDFKALWIVIQWDQN